MSQQPHFVATAQAQDISAGREAGCFLAQYALGGNLSESGPLMYATAETAPADDLDYFEAELGETFQFWTGDDVLPTWVKRPALHPNFDSADYNITLHVARLT